MALPTADQLYGQVQQQLQGYGNAEQGALQQNYQNQMGQGMQQLASSGLAGTSIAPSMRMGYMKQYQLALNSLGQQLNQQRMSAQSTFGLGGIQSQQSQQGLDTQRMLGLGNMGISQQYANYAGQQNARQNQQQSYQQAAYMQQPDQYNVGSVGYYG
jgi:hypothetical protein